MFIDFMIDVFTENRGREAIIWKDEACSYDRLLHLIEKWKTVIDSYDIEQGTVVALEGDFSPNTIALMQSLIEKPCIIVPLNNSSQKNRAKLLEIAQVEFVFSVNENDEVTTERRPITASNELYSSLRQRQRPGLVLFTSGTSGEPKAAVHDLPALLEKFKTKRKSLRTVNFLLFDHWGGLNTMFHILSNGGTVITVEDRSPDAICALIAKYKVEL